jgi:23S rRNA pseudouridine1911/1915/1917 synthase
MKFYRILFVKFFYHMKENSFIRLDVLVLKYCDLSRERVQDLIKNGAVTINGQIITKPSQKYPEDAVPTIEMPEVKPSHIAPVEMNLEVVFEDDYLLVVNKPAGIATHPGHGDTQNTLVNGLLHYAETGKIKLSVIGGVERPGIVHRLDKDTSGLIIVAKEDKTHQILSENLAERLIKRTYHAICYGKPRLNGGIIQTLIERHPTSRTQMHIPRSSQTAKTAITYYKLLKTSADNRFSLIECELGTGRTHQIRLHMANLGNSLVGDKVYGIKNADFLHKITNRNQDFFNTINNLSGQLLHAYSLKFKHPITEAEIHLSAPYRDEMYAFYNLVMDIT